MVSVGHSRAQRRARLRQIFMNRDEVEVHPITPPDYVEEPPPPPPYVLDFAFFLNFHADW